MGFSRNRMAHCLPKRLVYDWTTDFIIPRHHVPMGSLSRSSHGLLWPRHATFGLIRPPPAIAGSSQVSTRAKLRLAILNPAGILLPCHHDRDVCQLAPVRLYSQLLSHSPTLPYRSL